MGSSWIIWMGVSIMTHLSYIFGGSDLQTWLISRIKSKGGGTTMPPYLIMLGSSWVLAGREVSHMEFFNM